MKIGIKVAKKAYEDSRKYRKYAVKLASWYRNH